MNQTPENGNNCTATESLGWTSRFDFPVPVVIGLLVAASLWMRGFDNEGMLPMIMEGLFYIVILSWLASHKSLRQMFQSLPAAQQLFLACLVGLMLVAQGTDRADVVGIGWTNSALSLDQFQHDGSRLIVDRG